MAAHRKLQVLFLCTGNSARSQMAEGLVNHLLGDEWQAQSAGVEPSGLVHPLAIKAMAEIGIDISNQHSKSVEEFRQASLDLVITLCDHAAETCPLWLGQGSRVHMGYPDPAAASGDDQAQLATFRQVRDAIRIDILEKLAEHAALNSKTAPNQAESA